MYNHRPENYVCPFCNIVKGIYDPLTTADDIVFQNESTVAFIASRWWKNNKGHVLVIPRQHFENIYDISEEALCETEKTVKKIALAVKKTYGCDGVSTRQHNEPAGETKTCGTIMFTYSLATLAMSYTKHMNIATLKRQNANHLRTC